jgi:3-phenylpropionate/cinnamic acid dioxygenase small subunit
LAGVPLTADDLVQLHQLVALHGHLVDDGELHRLDELFTADALYDVSALGQGVLRGVAGFRAATEAFAHDERNPVGHHVTNVVVTEAGPDAATVRSKGLGVLRDGRAGSVTYVDRAVRTDRGWRIAARRVTPGRGPTP